MKSTPALGVVAAVLLPAANAQFFVRVASGVVRIAALSRVGHVLAEAVFLLGTWWRTRAV